MRREGWEEELVPMCGVVLMGKGVVLGVVYGSAKEVKKRCGLDGNGRGLC